MQEIFLTIKENEPLTARMRRMVLAEDGSRPLLEQQRPGQFINIKIDGLFLRRPISVCDFAPGEITIVYAVAGKGTTALSEMRPGRSCPFLQVSGTDMKLQFPATCRF